ncbi:MAG TPA: type II toxin-antitoxin system RelE/ParE family toxin [Bryobacteraceae bacterium]|nr:type II toxin-antitoxin system RelE/ParE family toxin [Bryobacteraceae bacterium]
MSDSRYIIRPKADKDLDDQAYYYATVASPEIGHRFLVSAHDTFALLATQPNMGWRSRSRHAGLKDLRVFRVRGFDTSLILYLPLRDGVEILRVVHGSRDLQALLHREGLE